VNSLAEVILNGDLSVFFSKVEQDIQKNSVSGQLIFNIFLETKKMFEKQDRVSGNW